MASTFLILPIHLFNHDILLEHIKTINSTNQPIKNIIILEEPAYFGNHYMDMNYNKLKLIYHRATLQYYKDYITKHLPAGVTLEYIEYNKLMNSSSRVGGYASIKKSASIKMFNPIDTFLEAKYKKLFGKKLEMLETPLFLCTSKDLSDYHNTKKTKDSYYHASFYTWQRSRMGILPGSKTYDTENRNMMPLSVKVPSLPSNDSTAANTKKYLEEAITYVQKIWPKNLEPIYVQTKAQSITPSSIHFPITHETVEEWIHNFCKTRFHLFGKYEDSIDSIPRNFLFHSCITPMLNIGLITSQQVVDIVTKYYKEHTAAIGLANYEGFIRQIIGWREYQRYIYQYAGDKMRKCNYFNNSRRLNSTWYQSETGLKPVDDAVRMAIDDGYIHHILRLMVLGNFMNLVGIHPDDVYKWFMEFSLDSYDWVMIGNVYSMALWADGGLTMRKPYISGDGYIMKMGNYSSSRVLNSKKTKKQLDAQVNLQGDKQPDHQKQLKKKLDDDAKEETDNPTTKWNDEWNAVFHHFIDRNADKLLRTYYAGIVRAWQKKSEKEKSAELALANKVISRITLTK